jgi:hypothetical protein
VARRVRRLGWSVEGLDLPGLGGRFARYVMGQTWSSTEDWYVLSIGMESDVELTINALDFDFYEVDLEGGPYDIPDYGELDDAAIHAQQPNWNSGYRFRTWLQHTTQGTSP